MIKDDLITRARKHPVSQLTGTDGKSFLWIAHFEEENFFDGEKCVSVFCLPTGLKFMF